MKIKIIKQVEDQIRIVFEELPERTYVIETRNKVEDRNKTEEEIVAEIKALSPKTEPVKFDIVNIKTGVEKK